MAKKIISLDELAYFKSLLANVAISGDYDDLEGKPLWIGTQDEYETEASSIPTDTVIIITDDNGAVISINYADITNKPQINGVTLTGNKTGSDLGLVNAETGKGLSSNDYTANDKSKLSGIASGAQVNVLESITVNGVAQTVTNKTINLTLGTAAAKNSTSAVTANSTDLVESGAVKTAIDAAMVSAYKAGGSKTCAELTSALLVAANEGYVFTMSDTGTTTSDFIEGAGKEIGVGADVGVIKRDGVYKFNLLPGIIDTSNFITKSATTGLVKNDGSIDTTTYISDISGKADKVTSATSGNFAGLDANGNLTDSGKKSSDFATSTQGGKADTAVQTIKIGGTAQTKTDGVVDLPAYPTTLPASDTTSTYSATGTAPVNGTAVASAIGALDVNEVGGTGKYISKISETDGKISATAADMPTSLPASDTTDTYSATGTVPVSGTAVAAALGTLDVAEVGGSGKYIQKISETDGKISATSQDLNATAVGLGSVVNTGDSATPMENGTTKFTTGGAYTELAKKVDKVTGKGLSTNDYTTTEKNKLAGIEAGAEANVLESVSLGGVEQPITSKNVNLSVAEYQKIAEMMGVELVYTVQANDKIYGFLYSDGTLILNNYRDYEFDGWQYTVSLPQDFRYGEYRDMVTTIIVPYGTTYTYTLGNLHNVSEVVLPSTLKYIRDSFGGYKNLKHVNIPNGVTSILVASFQESNLANLVLPNSVVELGLGAFYRCTLQYIVIPSSVVTFGRGCFDDCSNLTDIYYAGTQAQWEAIEGLSDASIPSGVTIHYEYAG